MFSSTRYKQESMLDFCGCQGFRFPAEPTSLLLSPPYLARSTFSEQLVNVAVRNKQEELEWTRKKLLHHFRGRFKTRRQAGEYLGDLRSDQISSSLHFHKQQPWDPNRDQEVVLRVQMFSWSASSPRVLWMHYFSLLNVISCGSGACGLFIDNLMFFYDFIVLFYLTATLKRSLERQHKDFP